jgi:hypothetical protein
MLALVFASGCAHQDGNSVERFASAQARAAHLADGVLYRELTPDDFAAPRPPRHLVRHGESPDSYFCGAIAGRANPELEITSAADLYEVAILDPGYRARANPRCSWLDPDLGSRARRYALEHEQVHFGLLEVEARRLNREIRALRLAVSELRDAAPASQGAVDRLLDAASDRYLERSRRFDAETSHLSKQAVQSRWRERVEAQLEASQDEP